MNVVEGRLEHMEIAMDGLKAESAANRQDSVAMRKDIQELMRILGAQTKHIEGNSNESQWSVNRIWGDRRDNIDREKEGECPEGPPSWRRRVELPMF